MGRVERACIHMIGSVGCFRKWAVLALYSSVWHGIWLLWMILLSFNYF